MLTVVLVLLGASGALGIGCQNLVPGLDRLTYGVDITKLDLMPVDPSTAEDGYKSPIFTYTCSNHSKIRIDGHNYDLPDQVWTISEIPSGSLTTSVDIVKTTEEARKALAVNAGISGRFKRFSFSASTSFSKTQSSLAKHDRTVETAHAFFGARRVDILHKDHLRLGTIALEQLQRLPVQYSSNPIGYENFIKQFGTHYITVGKFGGLMMQYMETTSDYSEAHSEQNLEVQARAKFGRLLKAHGDSTMTSSNSDTFFNQRTTGIERYYGGNANLLTTNGISTWQPTISAHPWLFSTQLAPISDLVHNADRKNSLDTAITDYLLRSYLTVELPRLLHTLPSVTLTQPQVPWLLNEIHTLAQKRPLEELTVAAFSIMLHEAYDEIFWDSHHADDSFHQVNNYDQTFTLDCPAGKVVTHIWSEHNNHYEDRIFKFGCNYPRGTGSLTNCHWTDYVNGFDQEFTFSCPGNGVIKGWSSSHDNHYEDRRFKFRCCEVQNALTESCFFSGYVNNFDATFNYGVPKYHVLKGVSSVHNNHNEDRRFKFQACLLHYYSTTPIDVQEQTMALAFKTQYAFGTHVIQIPG